MREGVFQSKAQIATYPFDGNFHEFGFGMLYKDGKFHVNLSVSINLGGATTVPQGSQDRGTHITIDKDTGEIDYVAGGLRTPHGMGWGPEGEIFVTDNQGGWLPGQQADPDQAGRVLQPLHHRDGRHPGSLRRPAGDQAGAVDAAERDRQLPEHARRRRGRARTPARCSSAT